MKEVVIISGKGGTGKTSITASFAILWGKEAVLADCDVDASDLHILMQPDIRLKEDFFSGIKAEINPSTCTNCGICEDKCRFRAIHHTDNCYFVDPFKCEGCALCIHLCPENAISGTTPAAGEWYISRARQGSPMVFAELMPGAENSGKLVAKVKQEARDLATKQGKEIILIDGSPGLGCPVVSSLSGAHFVVFVTEASVSGLHDLQRVVDLVDRFRIPSACIINRFDVNMEITNKISEFIKNKGITELARIPYCKDFTLAMQSRKTIVELQDSPVKEIINHAWRKLILAIEEN